jgi:hypothetical protein
MSETKTVQNYIWIYLVGLGLLLAGRALAALPENGLTHFGGGFLMGLAVVALGVSIVLNVSQIKTRGQQ